MTPEHQQLKFEEDSSASACHCLGICSGCRAQTVLLAGAAQPALGSDILITPSVGDVRARGCGADFLIGSPRHASASPASLGFHPVRAVLRGSSTVSLARAGSVSIWDCPQILIPEWC